MNSTAPTVPLFPELQAVYLRMFFWVPVLFLIPGFFLNLFTSSVFMRKIYWKTSIGYYYTLFPLASNLPVLMGIVYFFPISLGYDASLKKLEWCKVVLFFRILSIMSAQYFHVLMAIDQALNVVYPRRFAWLAKLSNHVIATVVMYLFMSLHAASIVSYRYLTYSNVTMNNQTKQVATSCRSSNEIIVYGNISILILRTLGFILISVSNALIIRRLITSKRKSNHLRQKSLRSKEYMFAFSVMSINIISILLSLPFIGIVTMQTVLSLNSNTPPALNLLAGYIYNINVLFNYFYHALPFFIFFSSNKLFRSELKSYFKSSQVTQIVSTTNN